MNWNTWIRQIHRWLAIAFTIGFIINIVYNFTGDQEQPAVWVGLLALLPLILLMISGLYLFVLPYIGRRRSHQQADEKL